jgi:catechol 2,3-dioxygenase-like lactoylglutathione lyase family enzyme
MNHALVHVGLRVPDLDASVEHARAVLGVEVLDRDAGTAQLALPGQPACLVLIADDGAACEHMALHTSEANISEIRRRAEAAGVPIEDARYVGDVGMRLSAPNGVAVEIAAGEPATRNAAPRAVGPVIGGLDHLSFTARNLDGTVAFFRDVLGFRLSDSVSDQRHWLRCGPNHHTIAIFQGDDDALHHYAFETSGIAQLQRLGDLLATRGQNFLWGPGRHGLGANIFTYHLDPSGAILEVCSEMIQVDDEDTWVSQTWPADTPASAVMWGPMPPADFRTRAIPVRARQKAA